jgi:hypothetical protein
MSLARVLRCVLALGALALGAAPAWADAGFVKNIATVTHTTGAVTELEIPAAAGVTAGDSIIVVLAASSVAGTVQCGDTKGNR